MQIIKKILFWFVTGFAVLVIGAGIAIKMIVTKEFIAQKIEENINGRVEIKDISVPLWAVFSGISVEGFKIGYKDSEMKIPMEERSPMKNEVIGFKEFVFQVAIGKLITSGGKDFELKSLLFVEPVANVIMYKKGGNNLTEVLLKPDYRKTAEKEEVIEEKAIEEEAKNPFSIKSIDTVIQMGKIGIENGRFTVNIQESGNTFILSDVTFLLKDVYIDPSNLEKPGNDRAALKTELSVKMAENKSKSRSVESFEVKFSLNGDITPFDPKTGYVTELATVSALLHKGSKATGLAVIEKFKNETKELKQLGIDLNFIGKTQVLAEDSGFDILYSSGKITFLTPAKLQTSDLTMSLEKDSWMHTSTMKHKFFGALALDPKHTAGVEKQVEESTGKVSTALIAKLPSSLRGQAKENVSAESMRNAILDPARNDEGALEFGFLSQGALSSPAMKITKPKFPSLKDVAAKEIDKAKGNITSSVDEKVDEAKSEATKEVTKQTDAAKKKATKELKKKVPGL